ncbi:MAG: biotin/lipoyl-containing protein, partial [Pseudomonadota bacterium]|nr:biotin/lipoyl-containing protein [Pseudomonadota bacterium]
MTIEVLMPALSPTMTEGTLARWLKKEGDTVEAGDVIAEIETDKATMEVEAVDEGVIGKLAVAEGTENVQVNYLIAVLLEYGENASDIGEVSASSASEAPSQVSEEDESPAGAGAVNAGGYVEGAVVENRDVL